MPNSKKTTKAENLVTQILENVSSDQAFKEKIRFYFDNQESDKIVVLLTALSSPYGTVNCDFLSGINPKWIEIEADRASYEAVEKDKNQSNEVRDEAHERLRLLEHRLKTTPKTIAAHLFKRLCTLIEKGIPFNEIEMILNMEYNKLK